MRTKAKVFFMGLVALFAFSFTLYGAESKLKWDAVPGATGYKIRYGISAGDYSSTQDVGNVTEYALSNLSLTEGSTYYFVVRAYNDCGESDDSEPLSHQYSPSTERSVDNPLDPGQILPAADTTPPLNPQNLSAAVQGNGVQVTWQAVSVSDLSGYKVYYGLQSRLYSPSIPVGSVTAYTLTGLEAGKKYYLAVTAVDTSDNESGYSPEKIVDIPMAAVDTAPVVTIASPVSSGTYTSLTSTVTLTGSATDDKGISQVKWSNSLGGGGTATGTATWSTGAIPLMGGTNNISITAYDTASKTATGAIQVVYEVPDTQMPVVTVTSPTTGATYATTQTAVTLSGAATDNKEVATVSWANSKTGMSGSASGAANWSIANLLLGEGENPITITARDTSGNQASLTLIVTCAIPDTEMPIIKLLSPTTGATYTTTQTAVTLSGTATDNKSVTMVTWANSKTGKSGSASGAANWSIANLFLGEGENPITIAAHDNSGNKASLTLTVTCTIPDTEMPVVKFLTPTTGASYATTQASMNVSGAATDNKGVSKVTWQNAKTGVNGTCIGTAAWSVSNLPLMAGVNLIVITAHDVSGNQASVNLSVTYNVPDTEKPLVSLVSPTTGTIYTTTDASVSLTGSAADNVGVTQVTWANSKTGGSGTASGTTSWAISNIILMEGDNSVTIKALDSAGNIGTYILVVTQKKPLDTAIPSITLGFPVSGTSYATTVTPITLSGSANDNVGVTQVTWTNSTGGSGSAIGTTSWTIENLTLRAGANGLVITAYDAAGNRASHTITVTYTPPDTQKPVISLTSPTSGTTYSTTSDMITLSGAAADNIGVVRIGWTHSNGSWGTASGTTSWSVGGIKLQSGLNTISVTAYDAANNQSTQALSVTYTPPVQTGTSPPATGTGTAPENQTQRDKFKTWLQKVFRVR